MKQFFSRISPALFLGMTIAVICILHLFTKTDLSMTYIDWDISVRVMEDGSEQPFSTDTYGNDSELSGTYRFSGTIPEEIGTGNLLFETDGLSLTLSLNGTVIWQSESTDAGKTLFMSQGSVPLPENWKRPARSLTAARLCFRPSSASFRRIWISLNPLPWPTGRLFHPAPLRLLLSLSSAFFF